MNLKRLVFSILFAVIFIGQSAAEEVDPKIGHSVTINVLGHVNRPDRFIIPDTGTILDALASAGGTLGTANLTKVRVIHRSDSEEPESSIIDVKAILNGTAKDVVLRDGDTVYVTESVF